MSVNTQNMPYEIWLIGAISAWDKLEMTTISFPFSFSITLHKKSHFLAFLLIMNCTVLCPTGPSSQRPKTPTEEQCWCQTHWQKADFNKAMGNSFSKEGCSVWRQDDSQIRGWRHSNAHKAGCTRDTPFLFTHMSTEICVQTLMSWIGWSLWKYIMSCCIITEELCNSWSYEQLIGRLVGLL